MYTISIYRSNHGKLSMTSHALKSVFQTSNSTAHNFSIANHMTPAALDVKKTTAPVYMDNISENIVFFIGFDI